MKRQTALVATFVLSLLFIATIPAGASTLTVGQPAQHSQLPNSSVLQITNSLPEGFHDGWEGQQNQFSCSAFGWATDPDDRSIDLTVRVLSDGIEVVQAAADVYRPDLEAADICSDGICGFDVNLWGLISPGAYHLITVQAQDAQTSEWVDLSNTPKTLNCSEVNVLPEGFHDFSEGTQNQFSCVAEGWTADPNDRNVDLNVRILSDGVEVAQTVGDAFRQDLDDAGVCPGGTCSFSVNLWGLIAPDVEHTITIQAQDAQSLEWVDLSNTQKSLSCIGPSWQQLSTNGFGDNQTIGVISLQDFQNRLYTGTANGSGGSVWRQQPDGQWQQVSEPGFGGGSAATAIIDLAVFQGRIYAGIGWGDAPGQVWRSGNGTSWQPVTTDGFGESGNTAITNFAVFKGQLYAGTGTLNGSAQIWRSISGSSNTWTQVAPDGPGLSGNVTGFAVYKGVLYAAVESSSGIEPAQVWRSTNGSDWTTVTADGFGDPNNISTGGFAQFGGYLYVGTRNEATGGQLWRTIDGLHWDMVIGDGFGEVNNIKVEALLVHDDLLYAVTFNPQTGLQIWRSEDALNWEQIISNGFGDSNNFSTLWNNAFTEFQGHIVIGTWNNVDGGELWMSTP
jgi:hypothetical protein